MYDAFRPKLKNKGDIRLYQKNVL